MKTQTGGSVLICLVEEVEFRDCFISFWTVLPHNSSIFVIVSPDDSIRRSETKTRRFFRI